jgi:plasmid stabilization system protein ParE
MSTRVFERPQARKDFWDIVHYLAIHSVVAAERFLNAVENSHSFLADFPISGTLIEDDDLSLKDIRIKPIKDFEKYLILFRSRTDRVEILRYSHASRDLNALLQNL